MIRVKELILVEGKYDKNTLSQVVDATIIETSGFGIFNDGKKMKMIRELTVKNGVVIFTDSDAAGMMIRNHLKNVLPADLIKNAYTPDVSGKEKRKKSPGKEGKLGVEGMPPDVIIECLRRAGATLDDVPTEPVLSRITKADMFSLGLSGRLDSNARRKKLKQYLDLPDNLSATALLDVLNVMMEKQDLLDILRNADLLPEDPTTE